MGSWLYDKESRAVLMVDPGEVSDPLNAYVAARVQVRRVRRARAERGPE